MSDYFGKVESGFKYFDTAFVYPGSEVATKKALVDPTFESPSYSRQKSTPLYAPRPKRRRVLHRRRQRDFPDGKDRRGY